MKSPKYWKPIIIENSSIPKILSYISPISIGAITLGFIVFSKKKIDERTRRHEIIHFQQFLETLFIGFLILYVFDYVINQLKYVDNNQAYRMIRAEKEAYDNEGDPDYLSKRKRFKWIMQ